MLPSLGVGHTCVVACLCPLLEAPGLPELELVPGPLRIVAMRSYLDVWMRPINEDACAEHGRHQPQVTLEVLMGVREVRMEPYIIHAYEETNVARGPLDLPVIISKLGKFP